MTTNSPASQSGKEGTPQFVPKREKNSPNNDSIQSNSNNMSFGLSPTTNPEPFSIKEPTKGISEFSLVPQPQPQPRQRSLSIFKDTKVIKEINQQQNEENTFFEADEKNENKNKILDSQWVVNNLLMEKVTEQYSSLKEIVDKSNILKNENLLEKAILEVKKQKLEKQEQEEREKSTFNYVEQNKRLKSQNQKMITEMEQIEKERVAMKQQLEEKYKEMKRLKEKLKDYVDRMNKIQKEINSREFAMMDRSITYEKDEMMDVNFGSEQSELSINETYQRKDD